MQIVYGNEDDSFIYVDPLFGVWTALRPGNN